MQSGRGTSDADHVHIMFAGAAEVFGIEREWDARNTSSTGTVTPSTKSTFSYHGTPFLRRNFSPTFAPRRKNSTIAVPAIRFPQRMICAYHLRDSKTGQGGPWLAGP